VTLAEVIQKIEEGDVEWLASHKDFLLRYEWWTEFVRLRTAALILPE